MLALRLATSDAAAIEPQGSSFSPSSLFASGQNGIWLDPSDLSTMFQSGTRASPGTPVAADGDPVGLWLDKSGNQHDATQSTAGSRPLYKTSGGISWLQFDGVDDFLALPNFLGSFTSGMALFAAKSSADPAVSGTAVGPVLGDFGTAGLGDTYPFTDGHVYDGFLSTVRKDCGNPTPSLASWHVGEFRSASGSFAYAINGTDVFTTATNTVGKGTAPLIGKTSLAGGAYPGSVGRIIVTDSVLTGTNRTNARTSVGAGSGLIL